VALFDLWVSLLELPWSFLLEPLWASWMWKTLWELLQLKVSSDILVGTFVLAFVGFPVVGFHLSL